MEHSDMTRAKYNICWISVVVIFIGTILYPILVHHAENVRDESVLRFVYHSPASQVTVPNVSLVDSLPPENIAADKEAFQTLGNGEEVIEDSPSHFDRNLKLGDTGEDVRRLQEYLNSRGFLVADSGPGSPGNESALFGRGTKAALIEFQNKYADVLLKPYGLTEGTGYFGDATRNFVNS